MNTEYLAPSLQTRWLKPTYRTLPEQIVGLAIFLTVSFSIFLFTQWMASFGLPNHWYKDLIQAPWIIQNWPDTPLWVGYHLLMPLSIWMLWRRFSFFTLKLEISIFLMQFAFQCLWGISFFIFKESLLSLFALLFLLCNTLLCVLLYRKKEKAARFLLIPSFLWVFYMMGVNMAICVLNP
jgi:tryptophan-rich sensory protein